MARKRMLSPEMFTSESIAALPVSSRWTWAGMLTYLDDFGRGRDNAALIKAAVWPLDDGYTARKVAGDLDRLVEIGSLCRYECCGSALLHSPTWAGYQRVSHPTASKLCPCPTHEEPHPNSSGAAPELPGKTPHSVVKSSSDQFSASAAVTDVGTRILDGYVHRHGALPRQVKRRLGEQIDLLIADGITEPQVCRALDAWAAKPDAAPGLLPHLVKPLATDLRPSKAYIREQA